MGSSDRPRCKEDAVLTLSGDDDCGHHDQLPPWRHDQQYTAPGESVAAASAAGDHLALEMSAKPHEV